MKKRVFSILLICSLLLGFMPAISPVGVAEAAETTRSTETAEGMSSLVFGNTISAGTAYMTAIKEDGTLWAWGFNYHNQLGIGRTEEPIFSPIQVPLDKKVVSVAASGNSTAVLTEDGELWNWGSHDANGKLGREASGEYVPPGKVMGGVRDISCGGIHSAAVTYDGTLWVWGGNQQGQLGNGRKGGRLFVNDFLQYSYEALPVRAMDNVLAVEARSNQTFAILSDHSLWAWGANGHGQLCNDDSVWSYGEQHDDSLLGEMFTESWVYEEDFAMIGDDGVLYTAPAGFTHTSTYIFQSTPIKVMEDVEAVSTDGYTMILKTDGSVWVCRGKRELPAPEGRYSSGKYTYGPEKVLEDVVQVSTGGLNFAAIKSDGSLWTWGANYSGQVGCGDREWRREPVKIMEDVVSVSVGEDFMAALKSDGSLWMWGYNAFGQLGLGDEELVRSEVPVKVMDGVALPGTAATFELAEQFQMPGSTSGSMPGAPAPWMNIPQNAGYFGGNAYALYTGTNYTWSQAEAYCEQQGGHLAVISSEDELEYVRQIDADFYLGSYVDREGYFQWVTGENWSCDGWAPGEPWSGDCLVMRGGLWYGGDSNSSPGYFLCEWEGGSTYTIYFDANGGTVNSASKQVYNGYPCGPLPIAVRRGYSFQGWYTDDGRLLTANSLIETSADATVHAQWAVNKGGPTINDVTYSFANSANDLGYEEGEKIPLERYLYMFGNTKAAKKAFKAAKAWNGSCFGMVSSATALYMDNNSVPPSQLSLSDGNDEYTVKQLIESMHILQCSNIYQQARGKNDNNYKSLARAVQNFQDTNTQPIFISFWGPLDRKTGERPGHSVLGLGIYRDKANKKDVIQIYDPNFPGDPNRYIDLYWKTPGKYTGWYYCFNDVENWGSSFGKGTITYAAYSDVMELWNKRGSAAILTANTMSLNCANATIYDYAGNPAATVRDGQVTSNRSDIFAFVEPLEAGGAGKENNGIILWVPSEYFTVVNEDPDVKELSVQVSGQSTTLSVKTSSDRILVYADADAEANVALVSGKDENYEMVFTSTGSGEVRLAGTTKENVPACFAQISGELRGMGIGVGENSQLSINGQAATAEDVSQTTVAELVSSASPSSISSVFADVPGDSYYAPAIQWAYGTGIAKGTSLGLFAPDESYTRAQALVLLWQAMGCPTSSATEQPFTDVHENDEFYQAVVWAVNAGVTVGTSRNRFSPGRICTDWEFLTLLWRALGKPGKRTELTGFHDAMEWAENLGLLEGTDRAAPCLRRDALTFLYRMFS